ncbi:hypothetical protein ES703_31965 [subsurface metagenome]
MKNGVGQKKYYIRAESERVEIQKRRVAVSMAWSFFRVNPRKSPVFVYKRIKHGVKCIYAIILERETGETLVFKRKKTKMVKI